MELSKITIRPLTALQEMRSLHDIQRIAWKLDSDVEIVPDHQLFTSQKNGGVVLGAFDGETLVGFSYGFPGLKEDNTLIFCLHMLAVLPAYRSYGVGYNLKLSLREEVLAKNIDTITWTYDPLETANARLNVFKLGGVSRVYHEDLYGSLTGVNQGLPSDRLVVEWKINADRVRAILQGNRPEYKVDQNKVLLAEARNSTIFPIQQEKKDQKIVIFEIPRFFQKVKEDDLELALEWRLRVREVFSYYFAKGYRMEGYLDVSEQVSAYVLCQEDEVHTE